MSKNLRANLKVNSKENKEKDNQYLILYEMKKKVKNVHSVRHGSKNFEMDYKH